jgi:translation initiation factor 2 gamma subunit (eIF-2gamma)
MVDAPGHIVALAGETVTTGTALITTVVVVLNAEHPPEAATVYVTV